jgi:hypothetical protein
MSTDNLYQEKASMLRKSSNGSFNYDLNEEKIRINNGEELYKKELLNKWQKDHFDDQIFPTTLTIVHPLVLDFLLSFDLIFVYDEIAKRNNLDKNKRNLLPKIVWKLVQIKNWNALSQQLETALGLEYSTCVAIAAQLQEKIINKVVFLSEKAITKNAERIRSQDIETKEIFLPLAGALLEYLSISQQAVTSNEIKLNSGEVVRPSIKNWITDYRDNLGGAKHSPIERGKYLFQSENGKRLTNGDRQKLGLILKSLDDETPLKIDPKNERIVFENEDNSVSGNLQAAASTQTKETQDIFEKFAPKNVQKAAAVFNQVRIIEKNVEPELELRTQKMTSENYNEQENIEVPQLFETPIENPRLQKSYSPNFVSASRQQTSTTDVPAVSKFEYAQKKEIPVLKAQEQLSGSVSFSSVHKMPVEKKEEPPVLQQRVVAPPVTLPVVEIEKTPAPAAPEVVVPKVNKSVVPAPEEKKIFPAVSNQVQKMDSLPKQISKKINPYHIAPRTRIESEAVSGNVNFNPKNLVNLKDQNS